MPRKQKLYHVIYKTTNLLNGKFYIGMHSTDNLDDGYLGSGTRLKYSIKKYGSGNHKFEILDYLPNRSSLKIKEKEIVNEEMLKDPLCMNLKPGGDGGLSNSIHREKFLVAGTLAAANSKKRKERLKWLWENDEEWRKNFSKSLSKSLKGKQIWWKGNRHSNEAKKKMSLSQQGKQKGEKNSQFGTCWITNGKENKKIKKYCSIPNGWRLGRVL